MIYRVLVIEDEEPLQVAIQEKLENEDFEVTVVDNALDALDAVKNEVFNVIWLDHYLRGRHDGLFFVNSVKKLGLFPTPMLLVSNTADTQKVQEYKDAGVAEAYIKNETSIDEVVQKLTLLKNNEKNTHS